MRDSLKLLVISSALLLPLFSISSVAIEADNADGPLTLNMQDADIGALIETVSYITGKNFIVDPRVTGKITIVSAVPTEPDKLYDLFLSVLRVYGFAAIESDDVVKIIPDTNAKFENLPDVGGDLNDNNDLSSTLVIRLNNVSATTIVPILRPLLPQSAHLSAHDESNMLIATDSKANLARLQKIINRIDLDGDRAVEVIRLQHANAADLVQTILPSFQGAAAARASKGAANEQVNLIADTRTNSILLSGSERDRIEIRALVSHLDTPVEQQGNTEVIYLKYAVASELVPILQRLGGRLGVTNEEQRQQQQRNTSSASDTLFEIEADDNMNALIVFAPPRRLQEVKAVISQLDIRRAQVLVEGVIAEVSYDKALELGVQWQTNTPSNDGIFARNSPTVAEGLDGNIANFATSAVLNGLSLGFFSSGSLRTLIRAIESDGFSNVLSTPTLMTMDNEEAEIVIGQNVPFVTGQFTNNTTTPDNPFQTIERQDVGIVLKVKPQINEGDSVKLEIEQEISSIDASTDGVNLITNKRSVKTNVLVDDNNVVVLGGLLSDDLRENQNKVPLLGDIPVLGTLFRSTRDQVVKTNLMIFLRPKIVRDERTNSRLTRSKYNYIKEEQASLQEDGVTLMPSLSISELPEYEEVNKTEMDFIRSRINPGKK